ncbi:hypothetical protein BP00DRAFT_259417 [Aspergillus indologenus CBS 114.80]|uniref:Uncharacterized protein n=1 Tax=Aspergillus indologenus CBS 114.80 TaxID=1450541 RepID=A0A2V5HVH7_9EURO|nr:hypothetical protein BP00DRAFT_259417 [Aspergillus indologenus CBS 114.80]
MMEGGRGGRQERQGRLKSKEGGRVRVVGKSSKGKGKKNQGRYDLIRGDRLIKRGSEREGERKSGYKVEEG